MLQPNSPLTADPAAIRADLEYMTAHWHELPEPAMIEVRAFKEGSQPQVAKFSPEWMDEAVSWIVQMNGLGRNIYAVRNPIRANISGSASDTDIIAARFLWADCDDPVASSNVRAFPGPKWSAAVTTGKTPYTRVHTYWALDGWCFDLAKWRDVQCSIAAHFQSDGTVVNPSRIMRVGGTVSWPNTQKQGKGYVPEITTIRTQYDETRDPVTIDQMLRAFGDRPAPSAKPSTPGGFQIDVGTPPLDRDRLLIQAMSGAEWHNAVIRLVASYVARGLSDTEIHALTAPLTLQGYTTQDTAREVQTAIDGARRKGWTPQEYIAPQIKPIADRSEFDAPARSTGLEWFDDITPSISSPYLVKGIIDAETMSVVYGPSNSGKTFFVLDLAFTVAIGAPWRGRRVKQCAVLYLAAEGGRGVLNRIAALRMEHGVCEVPLALKRAGLDLLHNNADLQHIVDLAAEVSATRPDLPLLLVIDTLSRIMAGGDENNAADMTALIRNIDAIRAATGAHILLVHHTGKDTARGARGHSSLRAATDTEIEVANENGARAAMVTKQRDNPGGETFAFTLKGVTLGTDQDGDDVTSCVVEAQDSEEFAAQQKMTKGLGGNQKLIADTFDQMLGDGYGTPNPGGTGMPEQGRFWCVSLEDLRRIARAKMVATDTRSAFNQAMRVLTAERGLFVTGGNMVWRTDRRISQ